MNFSVLKINSKICKALQEAGYVQPTPIQQKAIPPILDGRDLMGCAQTGTGKTCAFAVPMIQRLCAEPEQQGVIRALILTPTRELALQIYESVCQYAKYTSCTAAVVFGGVSQAPQVEAIRQGVDILIATPGRLWDLMGQNIVSLQQISCFVLDEADRMLDMGFFPDVKRIIKYLPRKRQTLLFSATIPEEIADLASSLLRRFVRISVAPSAKLVETIRQEIYFVERAEKLELLVKVIRQNNARQTLVFTRTKHGADRVSRELNRAGIPSKSIHGDKSQNQRQNALRDFKTGKISVLVATDIAARGIDINELPLVVNFEMPNIPETYVHRIGRTGRAGRTGAAVSFCDRAERSYLADIEKLIGQSIPTVGEIAHIKKERVNKTPNRSSSSSNQTVPTERRTRRVSETRRQFSPSRRSAVQGRRLERQLASPSRDYAPDMARNFKSIETDTESSHIGAHTPSRSYALSAEATARIRKKVEEALARRAAQAAAPAALQKNTRNHHEHNRRINRKSQ